MFLTAAAAEDAGFSIDSIKKFMDGLDPAALLPEIDSIVGIVTFVCRIGVMIGPILLLAMGIGYLLLAPKEANYYFGYRTFFGMGSEDAWRCTQKLAGMILGGVGLVLTVVMLGMSVGFSAMAPMDLVWRAGKCLLWEAVLTILANVAIHAAVFFQFNAKGDSRRKK